MIYCLSFASCFDIQNETIHYILVVLLATEKSTLKIWDAIVYFVIFKILHCFQVSNQISNL